VRRRLLLDVLPDPKPASSTQNGGTGRLLTEGACRCVVSLALKCFNSKPQQEAHHVPVAEGSWRS